MTRQELSVAVAKRIRRNRQEVEEVITAAMEVIIEAVARKQNVYLRGFGTFASVVRAPKIGRNISKNEPVAIPTRRMPTFKASDVFKAAIKKADNR